MPSPNRRAPRIALLALAALVQTPATAQPAALPQGAIAIPMAQDAWSAAPLTAWVGEDAPAISFARYEGMPNGTMTINEAVAVANTARFDSGTIEFDIKPLAYSDTGIIFRRHGNDDAEIVYARANPDCPAADDCIQYAPIVHGRLDWDIYSDFEGPAPIAATGWNHFRIVLAGAKMRVYVNHQAEPSLTVPKLQGLTEDGGIAFKGPAVFANLILRPGSPDDVPELRDVHEPPPAPGTVIAWLTARPTPVPTPPQAGRPVPASDIPPPNGWWKLAAEPTGRVNLSRAFGSPAAPAPAIGWLKTTVDATLPVRRTIRLGWARQITVFLNGERVFAAENPYRPADRRLSPNGRMEPDNASVPLDLRQGRNEIVLAVSDVWKTARGVDTLGAYGWAAEAHFDDVSGIVLQGDR